ncbi:MAG: PAS domain S-box protein [Balneolaceae bacterium]|nr:PAS domain S-box protein [Balneolaceae bacterium]
MIDEQLVKQAVGGPLFNSKSIPFCITTRALRFAYVNDAFCEFTGYDNSELVGKSISLLLGKSKMATAFNELLYFLKYHQNKRKVWSVKDKHGSTLVSKVETSEIEIGGKKYMLTITIDSTAEQTNLGLAEATEVKYKQLTENLPHIIWSNDANGKPVYMNKVALKYFGKSEEDFEQWDWLQFFDIEDARVLENEWDVASHLQNPVQKVLRIKNNSGRYKWFQIILLPQFDDNDESTTWTAIATDVDDRIKTEQKLEKANRRLRSLIDASPIPIYSIDKKGLVKEFWNPSAERIFGWKKEEVIGNFIPLASEEYIEEYNGFMKQIQRDGHISVVTKRKNKFGKELIIDVHGGCIYDENGDIDELMVTLLDITEIEQQKDHLRESLAEKNTLLQEIHHRVKNNLAIVVSLLQLQVYQSTNEAEKSKLLDAQNRVMSIAMIHELLYSSEEFNKVDLKAYYDQLIRSIKANMQVQTRRVQHELDITLENLNINQAIPLGLLINELLTNSLKYAFPKNTDANIIKLAIHPYDKSIHVEYEDNGVGFDMSEGEFSTGLGFKIIESLLTQLEAESEMDTKNGFRLKFSFTNKLQDTEHSELA